MEYDIVMEGGGAKGTVFAGALQELEARGHTFDRLMGTSAGAITATLLAAGYTSAEMLEALNEKVDGSSVFNTFMGEPGAFSDEEIERSSVAGYLRQIDIPFMTDGMESRFDHWLLNALLKVTNFRHAFSFVERGGWYEADAFVDWMRVKLNSGDYKGQPRNFGDHTFARFFEATNTALTLIATDTTGERMLVLNHLTAPDCPILWATRMSMSIPFLWQEVVWDESWGLYRGERIAGSRIVDGGALSNFPIELFISKLDHVTAVMGPKRSQNILGLLIDERMPVINAPAIPAKSNASNSSSNGGIGSFTPIQRFGALLNTITTAHDKMVIDAFQRLVIRLPAGGYGTIEFDMTDERRDALIDAGREATRRYFDLKPAAAPMGVLAMPQDPASVADNIATQMLR